MGCAAHMSIRLDITQFGGFTNLRILHVWNPQDFFGTSCWFLEGFSTTFPTFSPITIVYRLNGLVGHPTNLPERYTVLPFQIIVT